jgi:hypothetical protein
MHNQPMFGNVYSMTSRTTGFFKSDTGDTGILQDGLLPHGEHWVSQNMSKSIIIMSSSSSCHHHHHHVIIIIIMSSSSSS